MEQQSQPVVENINESEAVLDEKTQRLIDEQVEKRVQERLSPIKSKLDNVYQERDKIKKESKEKGETLEEKLRLQTEQLDNLMKQNRKMSRDSAVNQHISGLDFINNKASSVVVKEITSQLKQNEDGQWIGKNNGESIDQLIKDYRSNKENAFLFKPKVSSGSKNSNQSNPNGTITKTITSKPSSLSELSVEDGLKAIDEGWFKDNPNDLWQHDLGQRLRR